MVKPIQGRNLLRRISASTILVLLATAHVYDGLAHDGIVPLLQSHFSINDSTTAMAKTFSSISASLSLVIMMLYGDSFNMRTILVLSTLFYGIFNGLSLFCGPNKYWLFVLFRTLSAFATSAFTMLIPVVMADFFKGRSLGRALMLSAFVGMIGSLASTSISSFFVTSSLPWQYSLILGPALSLLLLPILWLLFPHRAQHSGLLKRRGVFDSFSLFSIKTCLLMTIGMSLGAFFLKSSLFWMPSFLLSAFNESPTVYEGMTYTTVITTKSMAELAGTLTGLPLLVWLAEQWHFGFSFFCLSSHGFSRAIPIVVSLTTLAAAAAAAGQIHFASQSYAGLLISAFTNSLMGAPVMSLGNQLLLMVCPADRRTSALAIVGLVSSLTTLPAEQIVGRISDAIRGDSEYPHDRFVSLKMALIGNWTTFVLAGLVYCLVIITYPSDRIKEEEREAEETIEKQPLLSRRNSDELQRKQ